MHAILEKLLIEVFLYDVYHVDVSVCQKKNGTIKFDVCRPLCSKAELYVLLSKSQFHVFSPHSFTSNTAIVLHIVALPALAVCTLTSHAIHQTS
jgi:hypothetical protein